MTPVTPRARRRGLLVRLTVAPAVLIAVGAVLWWHDRSGVSTPTDVVLALFAAGAAWEAGAMLGVADRRPFALVSVPFAAALAGVGAFAPNDAALRGAVRSLLLAAAVVAVILPHLRAAAPGHLGRLLATLFPIVFVGYLLGMLREVGDGPAGARRMLLVVLAAKASDIGGYAIGRPFGRHRMLPSVSPGKTWEGTIGGLVLSAATAVGVVAWLGPMPPLATDAVRAAWLGTTLGAASILAGLAHSALKRRCGVKDSSRLLPEMGGLLDMVDSLLFAGPAAWLWALLG